MDLDQKYCFFPCKFAFCDLRINRYKFSEMRLRNELKNLRIWDLRNSEKICMSFLYHPARYSQFWWGGASVKGVAGSEVEGRPYERG
jgi:hypothetical protein